MYRTPPTLDVVFCDLPVRRLGAKKRAVRRRPFRLVHRDLLIASNLLRAPNELLCAISSFCGIIAMPTSIIKMDRDSGLQHRGIKQTVRGDAAAAEREATKSKTSLPNIDQIRSKNRQQPARAQQCSLRLGQILVVYALLFHAIFQLFYFGSIGATEADQINQSGPGLADQGGTQRHERSGKSVDDKCNPKNFLVLIKAGAKAKYQQRRKLWRESSCPALYKNSNVSYRFMLAMPAHEIIDPNAHAQGARASEKEISDMIMLESESLEHNDMVFLVS